MTTFYLSSLLVSSSRLQPRRAPDLTIGKVPAAVTVACSGGGADLARPHGAPSCLIAGPACNWRDAARVQSAIGPLQADKGSSALGSPRPAAVSARAMAARFCTSTQQRAVPLPAAAPLRTARPAAAPRSAAPAARSSSRRHVRQAAALARRPIVCQAQVRRRAGALARPASGHPLPAAACAADLPTQLHPLPPTGQRQRRHHPRGQRQPGAAGGRRGQAHGGAPPPPPARVDAAHGLPLAAGPCSPRQPLSLATSGTRCPAPDSRLPWTAANRLAPPPCHATQAAIPKQYLELKGQPIATYSMQTFAAMPQVPPAAAERAGTRAVSGGGVLGPAGRGGGPLAASPRRCAWAQTSAAAAAATSLPADRRDCGGVRARVAVSSARPARCVPLCCSSSCRCL